jgi:putative peptide zinc metalloprotease protein
VLFWHESGHGLACKSFGRRIHRAGLMFYYGMPAFFVDTSDMWMEQRKPRILVSLAGPIVNVIIGCVIAILVILLPISVWTQALFQVAYVTFLGALLNLNPLLEFDGYYILMDWLEMPQLRRRSFAFLRTGLVTKILTRSAFSREERIYFLYSILSLIVTALIILFALYIWKTEVQWMVRSLHAGEDLLAVMCLAVLTIAAGTSFILGFSARAILVSGSAFKRWRTMMIRIRDTREKK